MPFLNADLIREMACSRDDFDAVAPQIDGRLEPLHAVYHRRIRPVVDARIATGDLALQSLLRQLRLKTLS